MQKKHKQAIIDICPEAEKKIFYLREFSNKGKKEIPDPFGSERGVYENIFEMIKESTEGLEKWIKQKKFL